MRRPCGQGGGMVSLEQMEESMRLDLRERHESGRRSAAKRQAWCPSLRDRPGVLFARGEG
jgi:hypothetical protein